MQFIHIVPYYRFGLGDSSRSDYKFYTTYRPFKLTDEDKTRLNQLRDNPEAGIYHDVRQLDVQIGRQGAS